MDAPTWKDISAEIKNNKIKREEFEKHLETLHIEKSGKKGFETMRKENGNFYNNYDHPSTMENGTATLFWIVAMIISILFNHGWVLCILETIIWWKFITRHN